MPSTQHPDSYWVETGNPAPVLPAISGDQKADVVIVGAGFTGLSAAYHLSQSGIDAIVVEAEDVGWGASGRNGGMLPPRYKKGFASIAKTYGNETTRRLHAIVHEAVDTVRDDRVRLRAGLRIFPHRPDHGRAFRRASCFA